MSDAGSGNEIASAYVAIRPDVSGFRAELAADLAAAMAGVQADATTSVTVSADTAAAQAKVESMQ